MWATIQLGFDDLHGRMASNTLENMDSFNEIRPISTRSAAWCKDSREALF